MYSFDQIYTPANRRSVMNVCFRILGNVDDAEDAVQTAFMNAFANLHRYEGRNGAAVNTWLLTIARNAALGQIRSRAPVELVSLEVCVSHKDEGSAALTLADILPDPRQLSPETIVFFAEVQQMLASLPVEYREPLLLVQQGYSYEEMGTLLGMVSVLSLECLKTRVRRARQRLKSMAGRTGHRSQATGHREEEL